MSLYNPPLRLSKSEEWNTASTILNALEGIEIDYFYSGKRISKQLIELQVCTVVKDAEDNLFLRSCQYSGNKDKWKEVIQDQLKNQLRGLGVEEGFVKAETRWFRVSKDNYLTFEKFHNRKRDYIHQITVKKEG